MDLHVSIKIGFIREGLRTDATHEWLLACVDPAVPDEMMLLPEVTETLVTRKRLVAIMNPHVPEQPVFVQEHLTTHMTTSESFTMLSHHGDRLVTILTVQYVIRIQLTRLGTIWADNACFNIFFHQLCGWLYVFDRRRSLLITRKKKNNISDFLLFLRKRELFKNRRN